MHFVFATIKETIGNLILNEENQHIKIPSYKIIFFIIYILLYPTLLFILSDDIHWVGGWIYSLWYLSSTLITTFYLYYKDPALFAERITIKGRQNQEKWDKYLLILVSIFYVLWFVVMPLDAKRFHLSVNFPQLIKGMGAAGLLISTFLVVKSLADNTFTSPLARIQKERNQHVVSTGIYGTIRHPMYLGVIFMFIGAPMLLGSLYGILADIVLSLIFVIRLLGEEKMLEKGLEGYKEYKNKVKYRLIPFIW